jgi:Protein of unknown function (DUF3800)
MLDSTIKPAGEKTRDQMNIYIDESGSFVSSPTSGSWSVVVALAVPEGEERTLGECLAALKEKNDCVLENELKIHKVAEDSYVEFLAELGTVNIVLFGTGFDSGLDNDELIKGHQKNQVGEILNHLDEMIYEGGRSGLILMAAQLKKLSPQLYAQLFCQVRLMYDVVARAINYFVQRTPDTLMAFRWRIDQKNISRTDFEDVFEKFSPALLQTMSISEPAVRINEFDYSCMHRYYMAIPEHLQKIIGDKQRNVLNIQKIIRKDIQFLDSKESSGIQVADLVVSGLRRCLRRQFKNSEQMAALLGRLMVQAQYNSAPLNLITFAAERQRIADETAQLMRIMIRQCKPMLLLRGASDGAALDTR